MRIRDWLPPIISNLLRLEKSGSGYSYIFESNRQDTWKKREYLDSFNCVPEVNAVINLKANAFSNGIFKVVDGNKKEKEYPDEPILTLLNNPNWFQAKGEFMKQTKIGHEVFGDEYLYFTVPFGFDFTRAKALYTLPPNLVGVEYKEKTPFFLFSKEDPPKDIQYFYCDENGHEKNLDSKSIIHYNDNRINIKSPTDKHLLKGQSKLEALSAPINNIRAAYESRGVILIERGANGAWVSGSKDGMGSSVPLLPKEIEEIQETFKQNYGTMRGQRQAIISPHAVRWEQAGTNKPKDLGLFDETEEDFRKVQDAYGTPPELFARPEGTTYENQRQARKGLYVDTTIPEAAEWTNGLSAKVYPDGSKKIILDYTHLEIFQDDIKIKAEKVKAIISNLSLLLGDNMITEQEYREEIFKHGIGNGKPIPKPVIEEPEPEQIEQEAA